MNAVVAHLATLIWDQRLVVSGRLGFDLEWLGFRVITVLAIELATDQVFRAFFQDLVKLGGVVKNAEDFILYKRELPLPITMACALFTGTKSNLSYIQADESDEMRNVYSIVAIRPLLEIEIRDWRRDDATQMALLNAVYVGAGQPLELVLDAHQVSPSDKRIPLAQTTLSGLECSFEQVATLGEFTSCLRYATHFTAMASDLNPAKPWQIEVYAEDLNAYAAASEAYQQRAEEPRERI